MTVTNFPQKQEQAYWQCQCGCLTHYMRDDGAAECAHCGTIAEGAGAWAMPAESQQKVDQDEHQIVDFGQRIFALKRLAQRIENDEFLQVICIKEDGGVSVAGDACEGDQVAWLDDRLADARKILTEDEE